MSLAESADAVILGFWRGRRDTHAIALLMNLPEHLVSRRLHMLLERERTDRELKAILSNAASRAEARKEWPMTYQIQSLDGAGGGRLSAETAIDQPGRKPCQGAIQSISQSSPRVAVTAVLLADTHTQLCQQDRSFAASSGGHDEGIAAKNYQFVTVCSVGGVSSCLEYCSNVSKRHVQSNDNFDRALTKLSVEVSERSPRSFGPLKQRHISHPSQRQMSGRPRVGCQASLILRTASSKP